MSQLSMCTKGKEINNLTIKAGIAGKIAGMDLIGLHFRKILLGDKPEPQLTSNLFSRPLPIHVLLFSSE